MQLSLTETLSLIDLSYDCNETRSYFFLAFSMHFRERYSSSILSPHHFAFPHVCIKYDAAAMSKLPSRTRRTEMHQEGGAREGSRGGTGGGGNDASANFRTNIALSLSSVFLARAFFAPRNDKQF